MNSVHPLRGSLSRRWLSPIKSGAFNRLGQCANSPANRTYCYAEPAVSSLAMAVTVASTHWCDSGVRKSPTSTNLYFFMEKKRCRRNWAARVDPRDRRILFRRKQRRRRGCATWRTKGPHTHAAHLDATLFHKHSHFWHVYWLLVIHCIASSHVFKGHQDFLSVSSEKIDHGDFKDSNFEGNRK